MARIFSFKGIRYNKDKISDLSLVTAPPYDVISSEQQESYYRKHEYNVIRLILAKSLPEDNAQNNRYTRAASLLRTWSDGKVLVEDREPSLYFYSQEHNVDGRKRVQKGFVCILRLEELSEKGSILPHEQTLAKPKNDRLRLIEACRANLAPIFGLYCDPGLCLNKLLDRHMETQPIADITDANDTKHTLWKIEDADTIRIIQETINPQKLYIADGHHRYETALTYMKKRREADGDFTGDEPYNHIMIYLSNMDDPDLTILPAHRLIRSLPKGNPDRCKKHLDEFFTTKTCSSYRELSTLMKESHRKNSVFGIYNAGRYQFLILREKRKYEELVAAKVPGIYRSLDVVIAHNLLIDYIFNDGKNMAEDNITCVKETKKVLELIDKKESALAIFLNPTRIDQVKAVASMGMKMPQKATYFYPKPLSGLLIHKFDFGNSPISNP